MGVFTVFDLHKVDAPLFWRDLTRVTSIGSRWSGCGWRWVLPVSLVLSSTSQWITGIGPWHSSRVTSFHWNNKYCIRATGSKPLFVREMGREREGKGYIA
eukprot:170172-Pelagomonas_calceolata.AAC.2